MGLKYHSSRNSSKSHTNVNQTNLGLKLHILRIVCWMFFYVNQTNLGLKSHFFNIIDRTIRMLIRPIWDWNYIEDALDWLNKFMLIRPIWDWNASNVASTSDSGIRMLIRPIWDWNVFMIAYFCTGLFLC